MSEVLGWIKRALQLPRRIAAVTWRTAPAFDVLTFEELTELREPAIWPLYDPAPTPEPCELLFPELATEEMRQEHFRRAPAPVGVGLAGLRDVLVSGSSLIGSATALYELGPLVPLYVDKHLRDDHPSNELPVGDRRIYRKRRRCAPGVSMLLTHCNSAVYGHWLLESLPKLLLLRRIAPRLPPFRIILPRSAPDWVSQWIGLLMPSVAIETYNDRREYLRCELLLAPTLLMHPEHFFHPELGVLLDELCSSVGPRPGADRMLYVSRQAPSRFRQLSNREEIEAIAEQAGLRIVHPETLSIRDQIALFAGADLLVGEFGSAMHNALFCPAGADVFCLNWINSMQSRIAELKRQRVGYLPPSDGAPLKYVNRATPLAYHIDPGVFRRCLRTLVSHPRRARV